MQAFTPIIAFPAVSGREVQPQYQQRWALVNSDNQVVFPDVLASVDKTDQVQPTQGLIYCLAQQKLQQIQLEIKFDYLVLKAPGMLRLDIPMEVQEDDESAFEWIDYQGRKQQAVSEGALAAQWFSVYFECPLRLMKFIEFV